MNDNPATQLAVKVGQSIIATWPGQGYQEFSITQTRPDENGALCAVFGKDGTVGAEAIDDLEPVTDSDTGEFIAWLAVNRKEG